MKPFWVSFLSEHKKQAMQFGLTCAAALIVGGLFASIPFIRPVQFEQADSVWQVPQLNRFDVSSLSESLRADGQWVVDPRTLLLREREANRQQEQTPQAVAPMDWTLLGLVGEGEERYAVILLSETNALLYSAPGDDLPTGEVIMNLTETTMSVRSADGQRQYRLFVRSQP